MLVQLRRPAMIVASLSFAALALTGSSGIARGLEQATVPVSGDRPTVDPASFTAQGQRSSLEHAESRLHAIGLRLAIAARPWCDHVQPGIGWSLHTAEQYDASGRAAVEAAVGFDGHPAVVAVVGGGPADRAGVRAGDLVLSLGAVDLATHPGDEPTDRVNRIDRALAELPPDKGIPMRLGRKGGAPLDVTVAPVAACRTRFELDLSNALQAQADGRLVQIGVRWLERMDDADLAVIVAHELSHNMLHHRRRLEAAGARWGLVSGFGRNAGLFRETEMEADRLAVHLLVRAGYDPARGAVVWPMVERETGSIGLARSRTHPPASQRIAIMQDEVRLLAPKGDDRPPALLAHRHRPLTGKWRALLPAETDQ
ncbi:M48 family metalloprotease [Sphingomonas sp. FW199]|uniref:M48 family metalloprotease n=1 Tax=Sphingomonas sp. FW199 TaxID=3400217 RepID=UPI003CEBAAE6